VKKFEYEAELIGIRKVIIRAETRAKADSIFINNEYDPKSVTDDYGVDHLISVNEILEH